MRRRLVILVALLALLTSVLPADALGGRGASFARARLHTPRLVGCVPSGRDWVFRGPSSVHAVALTFDDGPWVLTPQFVALLAREHVPATFFQIGEWIAPYGERGALEREMLADGDMIGDHTWTHPDMLALDPAKQQTELERTAAAIRSATGFTPCLWRAPYGDVDPALLTLARRLGFATLQWDVDPRDWALPGVGAIETTILDTVRNGAIIEEHDGGGDRSQTLAALPVVIARLRARGYRFETLTQLLGYRLVYDDPRVAGRARGAQRPARAVSWATRRTS